MKEGKHVGPKYKNNGEITGNVSLGEHKANRLYVTVAENFGLLESTNRVDKVQYKEGRRQPEDSAGSTLTMS